MVMNNAHVRRYMREVKKWIPCYGKRKREITGKINATILSYVQENSHIQYDELIKRFGLPKQIAASFVDEMEMDDLLSDLRIKCKVTRIVSILAAIVVALWLSVVVIALVDSHDMTHGELNVTVEVCE